MQRGHDVGGLGWCVEVEHVRGWIVGVYVWGNVGGVVGSSGGGERVGVRLVGAVEAGVWVGVGV